MKLATDTKRGSVPRRKPREQTPQEIATKEKRAEEQARPRPSSDQCVSLGLGVVQIRQGQTLEVVRWRCPKDLRIMFASLFLERTEGAGAEARLYHNDEYLGSIPVDEGSNSSFLAFREINFKQFDLVRVTISLPHKEEVAVPGDVIPLRDGVIVVDEVNIGPMDFIVRYK